MNGAVQEIITEENAEISTLEILKKDDKELPGITVDTVGLP